MKKIFKISFLFLSVFVFGNSAFAQNGAPIITYTLNGSSSDVVINPVINPIQLDFVSDENIENWVSIRIENNNDPSIYKIFLPKSKCDNTSQCNEVWDGDISPSDKILVDGVYSVIIKIKNIIDPIFDLTLTSPYTIEVNTSVPATLSSIAITTPATKLEYSVGDALDISGLVVTGTYSDESTKIETIAEANVSGFDSSAPTIGQILTITVGTQTTTYSINVNTAPFVATPVHLNIEADVDVPASCSATDTDGVTHNYPKDASSNSYLAICALEAAIENGSISSAQLSNQFPSLGLFVTAINGVTADANSQYWAIYQNGSFASSGLASLPIIAGDTIMLQLHDFSDNNVGDQITLNIHSLISNAPDNIGGGSDEGENETPPPTFNAENALAYLKSVQGPDGSFGDSLLYTDWVAIAFGTMNVTDNSRDTLLAYLNSHNSISSLLTDNERRAMALLALGKNPYSYNDVNYIDSIIETFDGAQFGDADLVNDDIFALIPLKNSGYTKSDDMIVKDISFLISKQKTNGSWEESVDVTAAAIQALKPFDDLDNVDEAILKAENYLKDAQNNDGGWQNVSSTSWAMLAESALNASWKKDNKTGLDYLGTQQAADGATLPSSETLANRIWATSYAIAASSQKSWSEIMQSVSKPAVSEPINQNGSGNSNDSSDNSSSANVSENTNTQTPTKINPVFCPPGDLFSVTTGQACTAIALTNSVPPANSNGSPQINSPQANLGQARPAPEFAPDSTLLTASTISAEEVEKVETSTLEDIESDTLAATAINALPIKNIPIIPIVLGSLSGIILLYVAFKFFIK